MSQSMPEKISTPFMDGLNSNPYFLSLPPFVQETIHQCGGFDICSDEDLKKIAENFVNNNTLQDGK